jgi:hypothetical protein
MCLPKLLDLIEDAIRRGCPDDLNQALDELTNCSPCPPLRMETQSWPKSTSRTTTATMVPV